MARPPLLQMSGISLTFGGNPVFDDLDLVLMNTEGKILIKRQIILDQYLKEGIDMTRFSPGFYILKIKSGSSTFERLVFKSNN